MSSVSFFSREHFLSFKACSVAQAGTSGSCSSIIPFQQKIPIMGCPVGVLHLLALDAEVSMLQSSGAAGSSMATCIQALFIGRALRAAEAVVLLSCEAFLQPWDCWHLFPRHVWCCQPVPELRAMRDACSDLNASSALYLFRISLLICVL